MEGRREKKGYDLWRYCLEQLDKAGSGSNRCIGDALNTMCRDVWEQVMMDIDPLFSTEEDDELFDWEDCSW